jgi:hypothetical protein
MQTKSRNKRAAAAPRWRCWRAWRRSGGELPKKKTTLADVIKAIPAGDWRALDPENTCTWSCQAGRVVIELAPVFAPAHVANIRRWCASSISTAWPSSARRTTG